MRIKFKNQKTGELVFDRELLPTQEKFWNSDKRFILYSGGVGSGKSFIMILKVIYECMSQSDNYFLMGRLTYGEIYDVLIKDFMEICHESWIKEYTKTPHPRVVLHTFDGKTSTIIFRNLDSLSQGELLGLNLGGFAIDQAEDVPENIFLTLKGRLRRTRMDGSDFNHRVFMTSNPKLSWLYRAFKKNPEENYELFEASTLENEENLPEAYIKDLLNYPPSWKKQYVDGIWDESLLADNIVFPREFIEKLGLSVRAPIREREGLKIFKEFEKGHKYQMGVDSAEGTDTTEDSMRKTAKDSGVIVIWDKTNDEEVATFSAKIAPGILAEKAYLFASWYGNPEIVPEMNSMGSSLIDKLDTLGYQNIYRRKEYDRVLKKQLKKVGFRTTSSSKQLLISHFLDLLRLRNPKIYSRETVEELKTFVYTDNAKKKGAGAKEGFHDDRCFVAGTKILTGKGNVNIENINVGDLVMTRGGFRKVVAIDNHLDNIFKSSLNGLIGTPNHPVITTKGIVRLDSIKASDTLYIWNEKQFCIEEKNITDIQSQKEDNYEFISGDTINGKNHHLLFTAKYGLIILVQFLKEILFIIKMIILLIIKFKISFVSLLKNITKSIIQKREGNFLVKMLKDYIIFTEKSKKLIVHSVEMNLPLLEKEVRSFVPTYVEIDIEEKQKVYNLEVEDYHEYFANGVLVHNCMATLLASFDEDPVREGSVSHSTNNSGIIISAKDLQPTLTMVNGKYRPPPLPGEEKRYAKWTTL